MGQRPEGGMKPIPEIVRLLDLALSEARKGNVREAFVMVKRPDGEWESDWNVTDTDELAVELRTARIVVGTPERSETVQ